MHLCPTDGWACTSTEKSIPTHHSHSHHREFGVAYAAIGGLLIGVSAKDRCIALTYMNGLCRTLVAGDAPAHAPDNPFAPATIAMRETGTIELLYSGMKERPQPVELPAGANLEVARSAKASRNWTGEQASCYRVTIGPHTDITAAPSPEQAIKAARVRTGSPEDVDTHCDYMEIPSPPWKPSLPTNGQITFDL